jgi:hypothetical protein
MPMIDVLFPTTSTVNIVPSGCTRMKGSVRIRAGCALKAHGIQLPEMETAAKHSSQLRTESCVMSGNGHCEA